MVLTDKTEKEVIDRITEFRREFPRASDMKKDPKRANKIGHYSKDLNKNKEKRTCPDMSRASINWNTLKRMNGDKILSKKLLTV